MTYTINIPLSTDDPSVSQGQLFNNFNVINTAFSVNHIGLSATGQGKHKFVEMPNQGSVPTTLVGEGTLYTKAVSGVSEVFYTPDNSTDEYRMTTTSHGNFSITQGFGKYGTYASGGAQTTKGGWTFLPGGLILQYGTVTSPGNGSFSVNLPITFPTNNFVMTISIHRNSGAGGDNCYINSKAVGSFTYSTSTSGTGFQSFDFMAIGN